MSAPPFRNAQANRSNGPQKRPAPAPMIRRKAAADPLVAKKKTLPKPLTKPKPPLNLSRPKPRSGLDLTKLRQFEAKRAQNGGWSDVPKNIVGEINEFPLVTTKRALLEGIRHHIMRLHRAESDKPLNLMNPDEFPRPVKLHRRDPKEAPAHFKGLQAENEDVTMEREVELENERQRQLKAARDAQRDRDLAQIAPVDKSRDPRQRKDKKESAATFYARDSEEHKKKSELRYEETLPWHLEDAEGKAGIWVGTYIQALSEVNFSLVIENGRFRAVPLERWYKFHEKPRFETMSLEKAESLMSSQQDVKRWMMIDQEKQAREKEKTETSQFLRGRRNMFVKQEAATSKYANRSERQDDHELDVSGDEFQDDDEAPNFEADDEDAKYAKQRIRREQIGANLFGDGDEEVVKKEEEEEEKEKLKRKLFGKQTKKSLRKLEHEMAYDDDSDSDHDPNNPFAESSDSELENEMNEREKNGVKKDEVKKDGVKKDGLKKDGVKKDGVKKDGVKKEEDSKKTGEGKDTNAAAGAAKGTTTPPGKHKAIDKLKKGKLKRPGSPSLSESSDNESTRKKAKTGQNTANLSQSATPMHTKAKPGAGGADKDGNTSDGGRKVQNPSVQLPTQKSKPVANTNGTPSGSGAGSPITNAQGPLGAASLNGDASHAARSQSSPITPAEIARNIPTHGISIGALFKIFSLRVDKPGGTTRPEYMDMVRQVAAYSSEDRLLRRKKAS